MKLRNVPFSPPDIPHPSGGIVQSDTAMGF